MCGDYVEFLALAMLMNDHDLTQALTPFDALYPLAAKPLQQSGRSALHELGIALGAVPPGGLVRDPVAAFRCTQSRGSALGLAHHPDIRSRCERPGTADT